MTPDMFSYPSLGTIMRIECKCPAGQEVALPFSCNYLRQGGYVFACICLWVCEFVSERDNSKTYGQIFMKFSGYV